ncbi:MAG: hypothetical protein RL557_35 [archaeon]|jgi:hypothetical protein
MAKEEKTKKEEINQALIDNFIQLQKVLTNLSLKFDELSSNMSRLLQLFELAAKNLSEKGDGKSSVDNDFLKKLDALLDQNKVISKGIMMMEEKVRSRIDPNANTARPRPVPRFQ